MSFDRQHEPQIVTADDIRLLAKMSGLPVSATQAEELCRAYERLAALLHIVRTTVRSVNGTRVDDPQKGENAL